MRAGEALDFEQFVVPPLAFLSRFEVQGLQLIITEEHSNLHECLFPVRTPHFWPLLDMRPLKIDLVAGREFTCLTEVPRKVDGTSFEADYELFESLVLCLEKATRESVLLSLQINATLLGISCLLQVCLDVEVS